jgi:hypothetical protein
MDKERFYLKFVLPAFKFLYIRRLDKIIAPFLGRARKYLHGVTAELMRLLRRLVDLP